MSSYARVEDAPRQPSAHRWHRLGVPEARLTGFEEQEKHQAKLRLSGLSQSTLWLAWLVVAHNKVCAQEEEKNPPVNGDDGGSAGEGPALMEALERTPTEVSPRLPPTTTPPPAGHATTIRPACAALHAAVLPLTAPGLLSLCFLLSRCVTRLVRTPSTHSLPTTTSPPTTTRLAAGIREA